MHLYEVDNRQKPKNISLHAWKVILISKNRLHTYSDLGPAENFKKYLEDDYLQLITTNPKAVYLSLVKVMFEVFEPKAIENILERHVVEYHDQKIMNRKPEGFSYNELSEIFMTALATLKVRKMQKNNVLNLFNIIGNDGNILSIDQAGELINNESKVLTK